MYFDEKEVNIELQSRPLKIVYLVRGKQDFKNAISLYTHIWGGVANAIFAIPNTEQEATKLAISLYQLQPDYILLPYFEYKELPEVLSKVLDDFPCWKWTMVAQQIQMHTEGKLLEFDSKGYLSHIDPLLRKYYPSKVEKSNIRNVKLGGNFDFELILLLGLPTKDYRNYLEDHLALKYFRAPLDLSELIKTSILLHEKTAPLDLTLIETREESYNLLNLDPITESFIDKSSDGRVFEIYLDDNKSIDAAIRYWNSKKFSNKKRLYLPKELFLSNIDKTIQLILEIMPSTEILFLVVSLSRQEANDVYFEIKQVLSGLKVNISIQIYFEDFKYDCIKPGLVWWEPEKIKSLINPDRSVSFKVPTPYGHENTEISFGFNAKVTFSPSGTKFSMPIGEKMPILLTNELERVENWEKKQGNLSQVWLNRKFSVWSINDQLTGTTVTGKECRVFLHSSSTIIKYYIKFAGYAIKSNPQTKYAEGFIRRFGSFAETVNLVRKGGMSILYALASHRAEQCGLQYAAISGYIAHNNKVSKEEAETLIKEQLPKLLLSGAIHRGFALKCPNCDLEEWYSIESLKELILCIGCAELFQLDLNRKLDYSYRINELAKRLLITGGQAVLMTAAALYELDNSGFIEFGGELVKAGKTDSFVEVDLLWLTGPHFVIAECKDYKDIEEYKETRNKGNKVNNLKTKENAEKIDQVEINSKVEISKNNNKEKKLKTIQDSFQRTIEAAKIIGAKIILLGIKTNGQTEPFHTLVKKFVDENKDTDLGIHLVLNGVIFPFGDYKPLEKYAQNINWLIPTKHKQKSFQITDWSLQNLKLKNISNDVLEKLETLKNKEFEEENFLNAIKTTIKEDQVLQFNSLILAYSRKCRAIGDPVYNVEGWTIYGIYQKEIFQQWEDFLIDKDNKNLITISEGELNSSGEVF